MEKTKINIPDHELNRMAAYLLKAIPHQHRNEEKETEVNSCQTLSHLAMGKTL